jgi:phosphate transport system protein
VAAPAAGETIAAAPQITVGTLPNGLRYYVRPNRVPQGRAELRLVVKTGSIIASRDLKAAEELEADDDEMDRLHRGLFGKLVDPDWTHGVETAVDITLAGRYYERYGDHAVAVARRVVFLVTGDHAAAHGEGPSSSV